MVKILCVTALGSINHTGYVAAMTDKLSQKIISLRRSLGINQSDFGRIFGVTQSTVSRWEKGSVPSSIELAALASKAGVSVNEFIGSNEPLIQSAPRLMVRGSVQAGVWREAWQWDEGDWFPYTGGTHINAPLDRRFGLVVDGESMNEVYPPGTILDCVHIIGSGMGEIVNGQRVIVVRKRFLDGYEATVKEFRTSGNKSWLMPRSNNPEFQTPIEIGTEEDGVEETRIIAVVCGSYRPEF